MLTSRLLCPGANVSLHSSLWPNIKILSECAWTCFHGTMHCNGTSSHQQHAHYAVDKCTFQNSRRVLSATLWSCDKDAGLYHPSRGVGCQFLWQRNQLIYHLCQLCTCSVTKFVSFFYCHTILSSLNRLPRPSQFSCGYPVQACHRELNVSHNPPAL